MTLQKNNLVQLKMPETVGAASASALFELTAAMRDSTGDIELDCSEVRFFDPLGMTVLAAAIESLDRSRKITMPWLSRTTTSYLERMNFFERIDVHGVDLPQNRQRNDQRHRLLEITKVSDGESSETLAAQLANAIVVGIIGRQARPTSFTDPDSEYEGHYIPLRYALSELIENALTHARRHGRSSASVWVACQYYKSAKGGKVQIAVVDNGCGFLSTLRTHERLVEESHAGAILTALKPMVSCNRDIGPYALSVNEGVGLTTTVKIAKATGGVAQIVSGNALVTESSSEPAKRSDRARLLPASWDGVAISATFEQQNLPNVRIGDLLPEVRHADGKQTIPVPVALRFDD